MRQPSLVAYAKNDVIYIRPVSNLGSSFALYRDATSRGRYSPSERACALLPEDAEDTVARCLAFAAVDVKPSFHVAVQNARALSSKRDLSFRARLAKTKLYPFQRAGAEWLAPRRKALLADEMGLGKTAQLLIALPRSHAVVVCPAIAMGTWVRECKRWRPDLTPVQMTRAGFAFPRPPCLGIVSYDSLPADVQPFAGCTLICDEAHAVKSARAKRTQALRTLAARVLVAQGRVWLATGTPLLNRPPELWSVLVAADLARYAFGDWAAFVELFGGTPKGKRGTWKDGTFTPDKEGQHGAHGMTWTVASPRARPLLDRVMLRRRREDVLPDLPTKTRSVLSALIDLETIRACNALLSLLHQGESIDALYHRLSQPAQFATVSSILERLSTAKIPSMLEHVESFEDHGEPLVVFSAHRRPILALQGRKGWETVLGDDDADTRARRVEAFQAGRLRGIAGTIGALGSSVTLTCAHSVLFVSRAWVPAVNAQAEDRVCRIGQDKGVLVYDLQSDHPLDERICEVLRQKTALIDSVL
jgi:SWI/SNF-related matrix-associated actin-dependent regulator of chromatin subfamily A-like protein 1